MRQENTKKKTKRSCLAKECKKLTNADRQAEIEMADEDLLDFFQDDKNSQNIH